MGSQSRLNWMSRDAVGFFDGEGGIPSEEKKSNQEQEAKK